MPQRMAASMGAPSSKVRIGAGSSADMPHGKGRGVLGRDNEENERVSVVVATSSVPRWPATTVYRGKGVIEHAGIAALRAATVARRALLMLLLLRALSPRQPRRKLVHGGVMGCFATQGAGVFVFVFIFFNAGGVRC